MTHTLFKYRVRHNGVVMHVWCNLPYIDHFKNPCQLAKDLGLPGEAVVYFPQRFYSPDLSREYKYRTVDPRFAGFLNDYSPSEAE